MNKFFFYTALVGAAFITAGPALSQDIGVLAAVNRDVVGERPAEPPRQLVLREKLILDERITTSPVGGGQVMFLDQTTLTLSSNSNILLDRYVYDPNAQTGDISVTLLKGAMRFVGGRISKTGVATIRTPSATIGIRGGIGHVAVGQDGGTEYLHLAGISSTIINSSGAIVVTREGGAVSVQATPPADDGNEQNSGASSGEPDNNGGAPSGGAPQYLGVATPEMIDVALGEEGGVGDGGISIPVTEGLVQPGVEQIEIEVSGVEGATTQPPISTQGEQQEVAFNEPPPELGDPPQDDIADENAAENVAEEIPQLLDGLEFRGQWDAVAGLTNGDFVVPEGPLVFQLQYSLTDRQGVVLVQLPDTGDLDAPNLTTLDGVQVIGDEFIVIGDEDLNIEGDVLATRLGGDATEALIVISPDQIASGEIFLNYNDSLLTNTDFVDGELLPEVGTEVVGEEISTRVNQLRTGFDQ